MCISTVGKSVSDTIIQTALSIVIDASSTARQYFRNAIGIEFKDDESPVTIADKRIEDEIRQALSSQFPNDGILGEEYGIHNGDKDRLWIIDPIDGTRSFITGHPSFGLLLALLINQKPAFGIVSMPVLSEVFIGVPGEGATLNSLTIHCSQKKQLTEATLYINEGDKIFTQQPTIFSKLMRIGKTRRLAHDCYSHALLAAGHVDAVIDYDLKPFDYLPLVALVEAAGGIMSDWEGRALDLSSDGRILSAATPELHAELLQCVRE